MKIKKIVYLSIMLILNCTIAYGQLITGSVLDKKASKPIPFANILIKGTHIGTVSNQEGKFELDDSKLQNEFTLVISVIGYKTIQVKYTKENPYFLDIRLEESVIELKEVIITPLSAAEIMENFYKNYTINYYQETTLSKAYYHSTFSENGEFKHLLEATVNIQEFHKKKQRLFEVEITQRRKSNDYRIERWAEKNNYLYDAIASNPMLRLSDFLDKKNQKYYNLTRLSNTTYNNEIIYVLEFTPKKGVVKPLYKAQAYFNAEDFALIKAEYDFQNSENSIKNQSLKDRTYHIPFISGSIQYQKIGDRYAQKFLSYNNGWTIINNVSKDTLAIDVLRDEILFHELQKSIETPLSNPLSKWGDIFKRPFPYHADYWNNQVKIPPTQLFQKAISDLEKHQNIEIQYFNNSATRLLTQEFENSAEGKMDSILSVYQLTNLFNGIALITNQGRTILHKAYGYADIEKKIPLDTATVFDIGSITKQFTTAIILKLREAGKLKLEDKIGVFLPNYKHSNDISIHHLMAHRSGIPTFDFDNKLNNSDWFTDKTSTLDIITNFCSNDLEFEPDAKMEYSNSNFLILTAIIEQVTKQDYYTVLNDLILNPLNMNSSYAPNAKPSENVAKGYVIEGLDYVLEPDWIKSNMKGAGCIYSTSTDLLRWINGSSSTEILSVADQALIKSPISYYEYYDADFGYSWGINRSMFKTSQPTYFYGGTSLGFFSMITTIPESKSTIILLNNTGNFPRIEMTNELLKFLE